MTLENSGLMCRLILHNLKGKLKLLGKPPRNGGKWQVKVFPSRLAGETLGGVVLLGIHLEQRHRFLLE